MEMLNMLKILIVEDEKPIANLIYDALSNVGYKCKAVYDGHAAAEEIEENQYDLILLDVMLPEIDGFELIEYTRQFQTPVIFLTAKDEIRYRVKGLKLGAEDYIVKPFDISELIARIEVVLRRYNKASEILQAGDVTIDLYSRSVKKDNREIELTFKEFELLVLLVKNQGIALYREMIYETIWDNDFDKDTRTVDLHIQRLRRKLGLQNQIKTVYRVGYIYKEQQ